MNSSEEIERRRRFSAMYERLRGAVDAKLAAAWEASTSLTASRRELEAAGPSVSLLRAERRAWIAAHGSPELQLSEEAKNSRRAFDREVSSRAWALTLLGRERVPYMTDEWTAQLSAAASRAGEVGMKGSVFERRLPGDCLNTPLVIAKEGNGALQIQRVVDLFPFGRLIERVEESRLGSRIHACKVSAFLGVRSEQAHFLVQNGGRQALRGVALDKVDLGSEPRHEVLARLRELAPPPATANAIVARVRLESALGLNNLEAQYGLALRELPQGATVLGRVDRLLSTNGENRALVVAGDALHLVKIGSGQLQQAKQMLGRTVELSRTGQGQGVQMSLSRGLQRTARTLWSKARQEGLGH